MTTPTILSEIVTDILKKWSKFPMEVQIFGLKNRWYFNQKQDYRYIV